QFDVDLTVGGDVALDGHHGLGELQHVHPLGAFARQFGVEPAGTGNVADQPVEPLHIVLDDGVETLAVFGALGQRQRFHGAAQRGQRVLELVGNVGGEALDGLDAVVEPVGHAPEGAGKV